MFSSIHRIPRFPRKVLLHYSTLNMEAAGSVVILASSYKTTMYHIAEDCNLGVHY
jgi:hypothetical protein